VLLPALPSLAPPLAVLSLLPGRPNVRILPLLAKTFLPCQLLSLL
jgi:hypothetical protein